MMGRDLELGDDQGEMDEIFGHDTSYEAKAHRSYKEFSPWHRPRKQFIREAQWCAEISSLVERIDFDERSLRYIGLPGNELFDLRSIHDLVCKPNNLRMRFLGFNNASGVDDDEGFELDLSTVEVKELERVDGQSKVMSDDFRALGTKNSMAWNNAQKLGHFDVVNVDLCDGLFTSKPCVTSNSYYNAIKEIINLQEKRGDPWLLFLTTRVGFSDVHDETVEILRREVERNLVECESFARATKRHLNFSNAQDAAELMKSEKGFSEIFSIGIGKWLISLGLSSSPRWKVSLKSTYNYTVFPDARYPDLISLVFEFSPISSPVQDKFGLVTKGKEQVAKVPTECALATDLVPFVANVLNVDEHLQTDNDLTEVYVEKSIALFEKARYSGGNYRTWLKDNGY
jgi:hypothetical protein